MNDDIPEKDLPAKARKQPVDTREERLRAALRANLMRRKVQVRGRAEQDEQENN